MKQTFLSAALIGSLFLSACSGEKIGSSSSSSSSSSNSSASSSSSSSSSGTIALRLDAKAITNGVVLNWPKRDNTVYNLVYSTASNCNPQTYSLCPGGTLVTGISPPFKVDNLENGRDYWFSLQNSQSSELVRAMARPDVWAADGFINTLQHQADGTLYFGGDFTHVGIRTGNTALVDAASGQVRSFPSVHGTIFNTAADGAGGWFIGGAFDSVGGEARSNLAHVRADGSVSSWNPVLDGSVRSVAVLGRSVFITGEFSKVNGVERKGIAALTQDGNLTPWYPQVDVSVHSNPFFTP